MRRHDSLTLAELNAMLGMAPDAGNGGYAGSLRLIRTDPAASAIVTQTPENHRSHVAKSLTSSGCSSTDRWSGVRLR